MKKKLVIIINGKGGSGKDTFCEAVLRHYTYGSNFYCGAVLIASSITRVKDAAQVLGWAGGKELKDRKFLSDLKDLWTAYNDGPFLYLADYYKYFVDGCFSVTGNDIFFVHIREPQEIEKFKQFVLKDGHARCCTLLIDTKRASGDYGNHADDDVALYNYDFIFHNDGPFETVNQDAFKFFEECILKGKE